MTDRDAGRPMRRRLDPQARRAEIITAATPIFLRLGYSATTYRDIAEEAGVTQQLVYKYFPAKDELFDTAIRQPLERHLEQVEQASMQLLDTSIDLSGRLERFHQQMISEVAGLLPFVGVALFASDTDSKTFFAERMRPRMLTTANTVSHAVTQTRTASPAATIVIGALYGMYFGVDLDARLRGKSLDRTDVAQQIARLLAYGLAGPPDPAALHQLEDR